MLVDKEPRFMEDRTLECPRCRAIFSLELTRCPRCGLNLYPEDGDPAGLDLSSEEIDTQNGGCGGMLGAVVLGWILGGAVAFMIHILVSQAVSGESLMPGWQVVLWMAGPLGAGIGGYAAGKVASRRGWAAVGLGALVGAEMVGVIGLLETRQRLVTMQVLLEPGMLAAFGLCLGMGAVGAWLAGNFSQGGAFGGVKPDKGMGWEDLMYQDLLSRVRFSKSTAERLIEYERRLDPKADRYTLIRNAVERLERDRQ